MGECEVQVPSDYDYSSASFDGTSVIYENKHSKFALLWADEHLHSWRYQRVKRAIDIVGALTMAAVALVPGLLIAAAVVLTSDGPVFYREVRIGRGGRRFRIWKFRSMCQKTERQILIKSGQADGIFLQWRIHKNHCDPRVTKVGGFLRRWSLDELPQLFNVLRGEMSLIGPRPVIEAEIPMYGHLRHFYLAAAPGLSGLWQVSGRSNTNFAIRADLDASYVRNWSLRTDFVILLRTVPAVLSRVGAR